jgi:hypothetical protein
MHCSIVRQMPSSAAREQFVARRERQRHLDRARIARRLAQRRRAHDEAAPR